MVIIKAAEIVYVVMHMFIVIVIIIPIPGMYPIYSHKRRACEVALYFCFVDYG